MKIGELTVSRDNMLFRCGYNERPLNGFLCNSYELSIGPADVYLLVFCCGA